MSQATVTNTSHCFNLSEMVHIFEVSFKSVFGIFLGMWDTVYFKFHEHIFVSDNVGRLKICSYETGQQVTGGATLAVSVSFISK